MADDKMLEAHVDAKTMVTIVEVPRPKIVEPNDIIIRVMCAGCNPKDWKMPAGMLTTIADCPNSGDDMAGIVHEVGSAVTSCKSGDRVAALHQLGAPFGAYAEFALVKDFVCFKLPNSMAWEEACTLPMATYMACIALYGTLELCAGPWQKLEEPRPLLVYGASSGIGSMAVKLAQVSNIHPVICVAGSGREFVSKLIDETKGDVIIDYHRENVVERVREVLGNRELEYVFDAISSEETFANVIKLLKPQGGRVAFSLPNPSRRLPRGMVEFNVMAGSLWKKLSGLKKDDQLGNLGVENGLEFARAMTPSIESMVAKGELVPHPHVVYEGGLGGLQAALQDLRNGKISAKRCIVRVSDTAGLKAQP